MSFTHCNFLGDLELDKKETPGCRLYQLPSGKWVPSITSVTSFYNRQIFINWRKKVGEVGEWRDKLVNKNPGWGEVLKKADKSGGISGRLAKKGSYESSTQSAWMDD